MRPHGEHRYSRSGKGNGGLAAGSATIWLCVVTETFNLDYFTMSTTPRGAYGGVPASIPGTNEGENFDCGGEGVGYSETTAHNIQGAGGYWLNQAWKGAAGNVERRARANVWSTTACA